MMGTVIHSVVDKAKLVSCRASPCEAAAAMCKSEPKPKRTSSVELDNNVVIAVVASVAVVILLLLVLLLFCFIRNRRQKKIIEGIGKSRLSIDENPDYGIYRDGCAEYSTVTDTNSKFEAE